jgi:Mg2+ and Co2+ transporter CorA
MYSGFDSRTNLLMKVLTIWGTVSIALVVLTGIYGMNQKPPGHDHPHAWVCSTGAMICFDAGIAGVTSAQELVLKTTFAF